LPSIELYSLGTYQTGKAQVSVA